MMIDDLRQIAQQLKDEERQTVFEAAHSIGVLDGKKQQIAELIEAMKAEAQDDEADDAE